MAVLQFTSLSARPLPTLPLYTVIPPTQSLVPHLDSPSPEGIFRPIDFQAELELASLWPGSELHSL